MTCYHGAVDLVQVDKCESGLPWWVVPIPSESEPGVWHRVMIPLPTDPVDEFVCDCRGFEYRGYCRHQEEADKERCLWDSLSGPEEQTEEQRKNHVCPRCGGITSREVEFA